MSFHPHNATRRESDARYEARRRQLERALDVLQALYEDPTHDSSDEDYDANDTYSIGLTPSRLI